MEIKAIIWDLGNVLVDWKPSYVFDKMFDDEEKKKYFLQNVCTLEWNEEQDAGRSIKEGTEVLIKKFPEWKEYIEAYYDRWEEMLGGPLHDTVEILKQLREAGKYKLYALTNWSAETFPRALAKYEFLHWFNGRVVSGEEKMRKPSKEFYSLLLNRYVLQAHEVLFIDDNLRNIKAAEEMGMNVLLFKDADQLKKDLIKARIL